VCGGKARTHAGIDREEASNSGKGVAAKYGTHQFRVEFLVSGTDSAVRIAMAGAGERSFT
jgi:hypothetical protein